MNEADPDAKRVKEASCHHETYTVEHTACTQRQFRSMGVSVGDGERSSGAPAR